MADLNLDTYAGTARIICATETPSLRGICEPLVTFQIDRFPKLFLAEFNTHRVLSRNAASSRAIPTLTMLEQVKNDPFVPCEPGANGKGMFATQQISQSDLNRFQSFWLKRRDETVRAVEQEWIQQGMPSIHKQAINRLLEPFLRVSIVATSNAWSSVLVQRLSRTAQPEFRRIAQQIADQLYTLKPSSNALHLPFVDTTAEMDRVAQVVSALYMQTHVTGVFKRDALREQLKQIAPALCRSVARCARVSYGRAGQEFTLDQDIERTISLAGDRFRTVETPDTSDVYDCPTWGGRAYQRWSTNGAYVSHASPFEHTAFAVACEDQDKIDETSEHGRNFGHNWIQLRELLDCAVFNPSDAV